MVAYSGAAHEDGVDSGDLSLFRRGKFADFAFAGQ
jgi:hypothetical protein